MVVAHPDDETLWCMGYLQAHPGTHVLCCAIPKKDPERIGVFFDVCRELRAEPFVAGQDVHNERINLVPAQRLATHYDAIITHNPEGEYGHGAHKAVHAAMRALHKTMWVFGFGMPRNDGEIDLRVTYEIDIERKQELLSRYTSRPNVFRNQSQRFDLSKECLIRFS